MSENNIAVKLTEAELDRFNLLRLKLETTVQAIRVNELELKQLTHQFQEQQRVKEQLIEQQRTLVPSLETTYHAYIRALARKYHLNAQQMGIDDETGALHDLREQAEVKSG